MTEGQRQSHTISRDGAEIAWWTSGSGPPLVLVHGGAGDHTRWGPLLPYLAPHRTVHAMDRRGRGASGDASDYDIGREYEDVAAVVDAVADASGHRVDVYGHSYGGLCAFGAAAITGNVRRLVLYEGWPVVDVEASTIPRELIDRLDALLEAGHREAVVELVFRDLVGMSDEDIAAYRAAPSWPGRVAAAAVLPRELRALPGARLDEAAAARITAPTLLIVGSESSDPARGDAETVAAAMPNARIAVLDGHEHVADVLAADVFAPVLLEFLREP